VELFNLKSVVFFGAARLQRFVHRVLVCRKLFVAGMLCVSRVVDLPALAASSFAHSKPFGRGPRPLCNRTISSCVNGDLSSTTLSQLLPLISVLVTMIGSLHHWQFVCISDSNC
jgi:hypothetical protein